MSIRKIIKITGRLALAGFGLRAAAVSADNGFFIEPSFSAAEVYDDNIFSSTAATQTDRFLRLSPGIDVGYRSIPLNLKGGYVFDAERYHSHPELDSDSARRNAILGFSYMADRLLQISAEAAYIKTQTPGELTPQTGLQFTRARAEQLTFSPSMVYRFDRLNTGTLTYGYTRDKLAGYIGSDVNSVAVKFDRKISRRGVESFRYRFEQFNFDTGYSVTSHAFLAGGSLDVTPRTEITFLAGPRLSDGSVDPEISSSLSHKLEHGDIGFNYGRTVATVLGITGPVDSSSVGVTFSYSFLPEFQVRLAPSYYTSKYNGSQARVTSASLEAVYRITRYLKFFSSFQANSQRGNLNTTSFSEIKRNIIMLGFTLAAPTRTEALAGTESSESSWSYKQETMTPIAPQPGEEE